MYAQINLQAKLVLRPVTSGDISAYKLPSTTEMSVGLTTVGVGQAAYLEVDVNIAEPASDINGVAWTLTSKPAGSNAAIGDDLLGSAVPIYEPSDRLAYRVAGRASLRPDVNGVYVVSATVATHSGPTATVAQTIIAANYIGISGCARCHNGSGPPSMVQSWSGTLHSQIFTSEITGAAGNTTYASTCWGCHTVGYDVNSTIPNGGFDKVMKQLNWTPPTSSVPSNWTNMPTALQNVANIQCENCHGPGSEHANSGGTPYAISVPSGSGACNSCHDAPTHHIKGTEWYNSMHSVTTTDPAGNASCVGCHTGPGFVGRMTGAKTIDTSYGAINCQTCHEPHGQTTPTNAAHLIRIDAPVKLADGTLVSNAGEGALCMNCHQARQNASTYVDSTAGSAHFGPHEGPQSDMLEGVNGYTYGRNIPSSAHAFVAKDTCVACHMQTVATTDQAFLKAGGHTFKPSFTPDGSTAPVDLVGACQGCHGSEITSFDFALMDYNGDGQIDGVQTEVQKLLDQLSSMLPGGNGKPQTALTIDATWTKPQLRAAYNWSFVNNDGSKGIHNTAYAVGLLKASIDDLGKK
ncbi:MAG TPA: multiheme c-type cytochrome [Bryobacteraceae bacterium]